MTSYLQGGWYSDKDRTRMRTEVVDGAMDVAGMLIRAGVPAHRIMRIALKVRSLVVVADPLVSGGPRLGPPHRQRLADRLAVHTDGFPELQGFINDCLEHVSGPSEMTALYLHLLHVGRMMQLLGHAVGTGLSGLLGGTAPPPPASPPRRRKRPARPVGRRATIARARPGKRRGKKH